MLEPRHSVTSLVCACFLSSAGQAQTAVWSMRNLGTNPPVPREAGLAYDATRSRSVLYGGRVAASDTWEYDGNDWLQITAAPSPPVTTATSPWYHAAAFDTVRDRVVLVASRPNVTTETWEWDGSTWTQRATNGPTGRRRFAVAFDSMRGVLVLFGGHGSASNRPRSDTWEWDGTSWQQRGTGGPLPRQGHSMVYDSSRGVVVLFGGDADPPRYGDTWEWDGVSWREHFGVAGPPARTGHQMAFDSMRGRTVMFGGTDRSGNNFNDTWEWDGMQWNQVMPTASPPSIQDRAMVFDSARNRVVMFAGATWEYSVVTPVAASYSPFGSGCAGSAGVPDLSASSGSLPRLGSTLRLQLTSIPNTVLNLPFGVVGFSNTTWGAAMLPVDLGSLGMPGCMAWVSLDSSETLVNSGGSASWDIVIPNAIGLINLDFYTQCVVIDLGVNAAGLVVSNAGHGLIGTQ